MNDYNSFKLSYKKRTGSTKNCRKAYNRTMISQVRIKRRLEHEKRLLKESVKKSKPFFDSTSERKQSMLGQMLKRVHSIVLSVMAIIKF